MERHSPEPDDSLADTVDELEERVLGQRSEQLRDEGEDSSPAFEQDVDIYADTEDQRESGSGSEPST